MKIKSFDNLIELAEMQLQKEVNSGKIWDYNGVDVIEKAEFIRQQLDKIKVAKLYTSKELRRLKYLKFRR